MKKFKCPNCDRTLARNGCTPGGKPRWVCRNRAGGDTFCYTTTDPKSKVPRTQAGKTKRSQKTPLFKRAIGGTTTILVTYAQNATPIHKGFVKSLENCANHRNAADIIVIPGRYKNPTSRWTKSQANEDVWADEVQPYLCNERKRLNPNLIMLGDLKVQPTSSDPLARKNALSHEESCIIGHPQLALTTVATQQSRMAKILTTTGACTIQNYTDTDAGKIGEFHHTIGAAIVEVKGKTFHLRQINASRGTGEFIDLREHFTPSGVKRAARAKALITGDTHTDFIAPNVERATYGPGGMVEFFEPEVLVWHDLDDNHAVNPHHVDDFTQALAKAKAARSDPRAELERSIRFVVDRTPSNTKSYIVWSNHNEMLMRWFKRTDPRKEVNNLRFWCETALHVDETIKIGANGTECPDAFVYWARRLLNGVKNVFVLDRRDKLIVGGIALHMHGHDGPNGARGSRNNLSQIGTKSVIAHGHGPGIRMGCTQGGTSTGEEAEYTHGPGNWMQTHVEINALNKRCLHNVVGDTYKL